MKCCGRYRAFKMYMQLRLWKAANEINNQIVLPAIMNLR